MKSMTGMGRKGLNMGEPGDDFLLAVITRPDFFPGEDTRLEGLLAAGLQKLHIRKPAAAQPEMERLLERLAARYPTRIVMHGSAAGVDAVEMALRYGISQVHGPVRLANGGGGNEMRGQDISSSHSGGGGKEIMLQSGLRISTSLHAHEEMRRLPAGISYAFISPLFDSISKPGYMAAAGLLLRPGRGAADARGCCRAIGLGGIDDKTIRQVISHGWDGAAVLGWIWEEPGLAVKRFEMLRSIIREYERR